MRACTCKFPSGYAYCSQELVQLTEGQRSQLHQIATQTGLMQFGESRQSFIRFNTDGISAFCVAAALWCLSLAACKGIAVLLSLH